MSSDSTSLRGDPKRQALPTLKGFSYQIWQSVYRWVTLKEGEALFLEGAEDIDVLGPGQAETIQVKETKASGTVTLRSQDILDAIIHFWEHQQNNPGIILIFRFLTTADRGYEQAKPFGDVRGLDYWDSCKFPGTDLYPLRSFFSGIDNLPKELRTFIGGATDEELRQRFIKRIEWDTGNKPQPYIVELVSDKVIAYGYQVHYLAPSDSDRVVPHLLKHVWDIVLQRENRSLTFPDFMRLFEEVTSESVSKSELRQLRQLAFLRTQSSGNAAFGSTTSPSFNLHVESIFETISSPLNDRLVRRTELVADLRARLNFTRILALTGSTGMGKSTLANEIATKDDGLWKRLSMRGLGPNEIRERLLYATSSIEEQSDEVNLIIDDLNFDRRPSLYEDALAKLIYTIILRTGRIIVTTQGTLPIRIINMHDLPTDCAVDVPALSDEEVQKLAANHGCPQGHKLKSWSRLIVIYTSRHPLLVHARVRSLEARGWPAHTEDDLGPTKDLEDIRREIRRQLRELLPSEEARTLAYRLSIISGRFQRTNALHFGQHSPRLKATGEAFDALIGPWVERAGDKYFRLSPLLDYAADENFSKAEVKKLHETAARAFISQETIGSVELNAILFHGLIGEAKEALAVAAMCMFRVEDEQWPELSRTIDWFGRCRLQSGETLFETDPLVNSLLRRLQFKITEVIDAKRALHVAAVWEHEIEEWDWSSTYPGTQSAIQFMFLNDVLFSLQTPIPIKAIVIYLAKIIPLAQGAVNIFPGHKFDEPFKTNAEKVFNAQTYVGAAIARCKDAEAVVEFLTALNDLKDAGSEPIWDVFERDDYLSIMLIDQIWIDESKVSSPNWTRCIERLEQVVELGTKRGAISLVMASYRAKATVQEEYLNDFDGALNTITEGENKIGYVHPLLEDYRAKILVIEKQYAEALTVWEKILPQLKQNQNPTRTFSYRDAEICAARLGDWKKAGGFALEGMEAAHQMLAGAVPDDFKVPETEIIAIGFKADYAFAQWKSDDRINATQLFAEILDVFEQLPPPDSDIRSHMLYKRVGYGIAWLLHEDDEEEPQFIEPQPGFFSNPEVVEEAKDYPLQPRATLWYLLAKIEYKLKLGDKIFKRFEAEHNKAGVQLSKVGYGNLRLKHALRNLRLEHLVSDLMEYSAILRDYSTKLQEKTNWTDAAFLKQLLFAALIKLVGRNQYQSLPLEQWKKEASSYKTLDDSLTQWFGFVERSFGADEFDLVSVLKADSAAHESRLLAALLLSARDTLDVEDRFYANVWLALNEYPIDWIEEIEDTIDSLVSGEWSKIARHNLYYLRIPNITTIKILSACNDNSCKGLRKATRVLLAVKDAIRTSITENVLVKLQDRAR